MIRTPIEAYPATIGKGFDQCLRLACFNSRLINLAYCGASSLTVAGVSLLSGSSRSLWLPSRLGCRFSLS